MSTDVKIDDAPARAIAVIGDWLRSIVALVPGAHVGRSVVAALHAAGLQIVEADTIATLTAELAKKRGHNWAREAAQVLIEEIGASGPELAVETAHRAVAILRQQRAELRAGYEARASLTAERDEARRISTRIARESLEVRDALGAGDLETALEAAARVVRERDEEIAARNAPCWVECPTAERVRADADRERKAIAELCTVLDCEPAELAARVTELRREHDRRVAYNGRLRARAAAASLVLNGDRDRDPLVAECMDDGEVRGG